MALPPQHLTGVERFLGDEEIIVSKTDTKGHVTYANDVFLRMAGYEEAEILGKAHSIIRHPEMPRAVFKLLWDTIAQGQEIFAYVVNRSKNGDHYWVFAHVTPTFNAQGQIISYHSNRRCINRAALTTIVPIYKELLAIERSHGADWRGGMNAAVAHLTKRLGQVGKPYDEFVLSL